MSYLIFVITFSLTLDGQFLFTFLRTVPTSRLENQDGLTLKAPPVPLTLNPQL